MSRLARAICIGTVLQALIVLIGHYSPAAQRAGLFPIAGTLLGGVTGWLTGAADSGRAAALRGAAAGGLAGVIGCLISAALGDVPVSTVVVAGGSTLVAGALGALIGRKLRSAPVSDARPAD